MNAENPIKRRIRLILEEKQSSIYSLTDNPSKRSSLQRQINQDTEVSCDTIMIVLCKFPDVSAEWLLRGNGSMLINTDENKRSCANISSGDYISGDGNATRGSSIINNNSDSAIAIENHFLKKRIEELENDKKFLQSILSAKIN